MKVLRILSILFLAFLPLLSRGQESYEAFVPIAKYLEMGDAEKLSAWFDENLEITVLEMTSDSSRNQARQIMKRFFSTVHPSSFVIQHAASKSNMKYALGLLSAGSATYTVTIFLNCNDQGCRIQQLKIEKVR